MISARCPELLSHIRTAWAGLNHEHVPQAMISPVPEREARVMERIPPHQMPRPGTRTLAQLLIHPKLAQAVRCPDVVDPLDEPALHLRRPGLGRRRDGDCDDARKKRKCGS